MRVAIVAESFLPETNGVSGSVLRILEHFERTDVTATVIAAGQGAPLRVSGAAVIGLPSIGFPKYSQLRLALVRERRMSEILRRIAPDIVHLASPMLLGHVAIRAASALGLPTVASFQTDVAGFAAHYGMKSATARIWSRFRAIHQLADLTLAPSVYAEQLLALQGIERIRRWGRGVDHQLFNPARRSNPRPRPSDRPIQVGYAGRLAPEKQLSMLGALSQIPHIQLTIIGDGPERAMLERALPTAHFTGHLTGVPLAVAIANLDIFVHPGENETFCQGVQEALACGVPAVVPSAGAVCERITSGVNGLCYRPGDQESLRQAVQELVDNVERRNAYGLTAAASVIGIRWDDLGDQLLGYYSDVIDRRRTHVAA